MLSSLRVFCFCGAKDRYDQLNSIETLQMDQGEKWEMLPLDPEIYTISDLAASPFKGEILLLGGE